MNSVPQSVEWLDLDALEAEAANYQSSVSGL